MRDLIEAIAFDLDDTLLDTTELLIPKAIREACQAMIDAGLPLELDQCIKEKASFVEATNTGKDLFEHLAFQFLQDSKIRQDVIEAGQKAFYKREILSSLDPFDGTYELLNELQTRYKLYLVTAGDPGTQRLKVKALRIESYFSGLYYVDSLKGESKRSAFLKILESNSLSPERLLSVGNRIDKEIEDAKSIGAKTCLIHYGEYLHLKPKNPFQKPDYEIYHIQDLIKVCRL